jgi:hypothetical protein
MLDSHLHLKQKYKLMNRIKPVAGGTIQAVDTSPFDVDICLHCQSNTIQYYFLQNSK